MRGAACLGADFAGLMHNGNRAVAGVFDDFALRDVNNRGTIAVAVPWHDATRLYGELAEPELTLLDVGRFFLEIDGGEHGVGHALARLGDWLTCIGFHLVGRTATGNRGRYADKGRSSGDASEN